MLPFAAPGASSPATSAFTRAMSCALSARTMRLLVRVSMATAAFAGMPGAVGEIANSGTTRVSVCDRSIAEAFSSFITWTSAFVGTSTDSMMRRMRCTLLA